MAPPTGLASGPLLLLCCAVLTMTLALGLLGPIDGHFTRPCPDLTWSACSLLRSVLNEVFYHV
jgi:hypothetical protein